MRLATSLAVMLVLAGCGMQPTAPVATTRASASSDARFLDWLHPQVGRSYAKNALVLEGKASWFHGFTSSSFTLRAPAAEHQTDTTGDDDKKIVEMVATAFLGRDGGVYFQPFTIQTIGTETRMVYEDRYFRLASFESKRSPVPPLGGELKLQWDIGVKLQVNGIPFRHKSFILNLEKPPVAVTGTPELWQAETPSKAAP